tara:strand:+ start:443 stop:646 length:204 start_codon:yes stop_codon:yes gene_type:complete
MTTYKYKNKIYQILITDEWDRCKQREKQILRDFKYCEKINDWGTIKNRITNGVKWGWLTEINSPNKN